MNRKLPYKTPEGYFEALGARLSEIPQSYRRPSAWDYMRPYLAYEALVLCALAVGTLLFRSPAAVNPDEADSYEMMYYADLVPRTNPYAIFEAAEASAMEVSYGSEDIVSYLIDSGTSLEAINTLLYDF